MSEWEPLLSLARDAVRAAAARMSAGGRRQGREVVRIEMDGRETKLAADAMAEETLFERLASSRLPMFSEESGVVGDVGHGLCWVIDPLDGSVNYQRGTGPSAISVALCDAARPVFGVVFALASGRLSWGGPGLGAWTEGEPIAVSGVDRAGAALLCSGIPARFETQATAALTRYVETLARFSKVRMLGSAASSLLMVAGGEADGYFEDRIMLWDVAGGAAIVQGAGGRVTLEGAGYDAPYRVTATNGLIEVDAA